MANRGEIKLPVRIQESHPRKGDALREEQHRYLRWHRIHSSTGRAWWEQDIWHRLPEHPGDTIPPLSAIRTLLTDLIMRGVLPLPLAFNVTEFACGMCSRVFKLEFPEGCEMPDDMARAVLIRFAAPLDPYWKTESEVATMALLMAKTFVPVPRVYFFDSSANNSLGLEWMIMELIEGHTFASWIDDEGWRLTEEQVKLVGYEMNSFLLSLRAKLFDKIGSLYCHWETGEFYVGPMVNLEFFHGDRLQYEGMNRGPFQRISEYFKSLTDVVLWEAQHVQESDREQLMQLTGATSWEAIGKDNPQWVEPPSVQELQRRWDQINVELMPRLMSHVEGLPTFANGISNETGAVDGWHTELMHPDMHSNNVLMTRSSNGIPKMAAIIDWDWTCVMPPPLVEFMPPLDVEYQEVLDGRIRYPNAMMLQLQDILAPVEPEHAILPPARAFPNFSLASEVFKPARKYTVKRALALRAAHFTVKRMASWDGEDKAWMTKALVFLDSLEDSKGGGDCPRDA